MTTVWIFLLVITALLKKFNLFDRCKYLKKKIINYHEDNIWNGVIDASCASYLVFTVTIFIESNDIRINGNYSHTEISNSLLAIAVMAFVVAFPFILIVVMHRKLKIFDRNSEISEEIRMKYS